MDWQPIAEWAQQPEATVGLVAAVAGLLVWNLVQAWRWRAFMRRWKQLMERSDGGTMEHMLYETLRRVALMEETLKAHGNHLAQLQSQTNSCLQQVGLVRYDAFPDMGGQQSFALAVLNRHGDGVVLSGIHSRHEMRVYAKPIRQRASAIALSDEEQHAIREASQTEP
ncbi:MAG: DUF4446 family protein [Fimbriimonadales bacterium]|nr:DUF4446 family protein [Fimbriimonadales bacterium]